MINETQDLRIRGVKRLVRPCDLLEQIQLGEAASRTVMQGRALVRDVLAGRDDRLLAVVGPCSVHDIEAVKDYASLLGEAAERHADELIVIMRTYLEKPRTTVGWRGILHDPSLTGANDANEGLRIARTLLRDLAEAGIFTATEFLDPLAAQFVADVVTWGAIGARTTESQIHRQLASGLSMPIGFKNGTDGNVQSAVDALRAAAHPHQFAGMATDGTCVLVESAGNTDTHVILRGGRRGPNCNATDVAAALGLLRSANLPERLMIDCSHANSGKDHRAQREVASSVAAQIAGGNAGIAGVMLESFLFEGRQEPGPLASLRYGQSITDSCMGWLPTEHALAELAEAVRVRRAASGRGAERKRLNTASAPSGARV